MIEKIRQIPHRMKESQFLRDWGVACISSVLMYLAFHPADISSLAWIALVPWLVIAARREPLKAGLISLAAGYVHFGLAVWWIGVVTYSGMMLSAAVLAAFAGVFGILYSYSVRRLGIPPVLAAPVLWVAIEYARSNFFFLAFPWVLVGHSQHANTSIIQIADFTGALGVSFVVVMFNAAIVQAVFYFRFRDGSLRRVIVSGVAALAVLIFAWGYGTTRLLTYSGGPPGPKLLIVQGNVPQDLKEESFKQLETLGRQMKCEHIEFTARTLEKHADLVVWPETMWPGFLFADTPGFAQISALAKQSKSHILIGTQHYVFNGGANRRNSAVIITPQGRARDKIYDKMFLVPISEYVPFERSLPLVKFLVSLMLPYDSESLSHGPAMKVFDVGGAKFSVVICFELSLDWLVREARNKGAQYLINISNDGWFTDSAELDLALGQGVFRAVENRMSVVRSVNTGISCFISPMGNVNLLEVEGRRKQVSGTLYGQVELCEVETVFSRWGNWFAFLNLIGAIAVAVWGCASAVRAKVYPGAKFRGNFS